MIDNKIIMNVSEEQKVNRQEKLISIESFEKPQIQNSLRRTLTRFPSEIGVIQSPQ